MRSTGIYDGTSYKQRKVPNTHKKASSMGTLTQRKGIKYSYDWNSLFNENF